MHRDKSQRANLSPHEASGIKIDTLEIHPEYELEYDSDAGATDTGLLSLFRLKPKRQGLPTFLARWDAAKEHTIDIDLTGDEHESSAFKAIDADARGYKGHHGVPDSVDTLVYSREICTPTIGTIFVGRISLNIAEILQRRETVEEALEGMQDDLRILIVCPDCGQIKVKAFDLMGLSRCPKCSSDLKGK